MLSDNQIAGLIVVCLLVGGTIAVYGVNLLAWIDSRDNRCIGDLGGEGLTPEPTSWDVLDFCDQAIPDEEAYRRLLAAVRQQQLIDEVERAQNELADDRIIAVMDQWGAA